jgi:copper chaperone CopZ
MEHNIDLILDSTAPESRQKLRDLLTDDIMERSIQAVQQIWGMSGVAIKVDKITLKVDQDLGDKKLVDALYEGKSCGDQATVIRIDDKWYIEWF